MKSILIVEDDKKLNEGIRLALRKEFLCIQAFSVREAWEAYKKQKFALILLDVNLPDGSGIEFMTELRKKDRVPVILLTSNRMEMDIVSGLELGANDYITKPFSLMALRARVERMRMRTGEGQRETKDIYTDHRYRFLFDQMQFFVDGQEIILSRTEQKLLRTFVWNPGITLSRERLMEILWTDGAKFVEENALSVAVNRLRHKLSGKGDYRPIETVYGIGYVWEKKA